MVRGSSRSPHRSSMAQGGAKETVIVSAAEFVVAEILAPALPVLWARRPAVKINLRSQNEVVSLADREADLAVRMSRPDRASLLAKRLHPQRLGLFASRGYLA